MPEPLKAGEPFHIATLIYPNVTQLDFTGPLEVLKRVPGVSVDLYWKNLDPVISGCGLQFLPTASLDHAAPVDLLFVPGGPGQAELMTDKQVLQFLRRVGEKARYVTSVCTGSLLLAAAGLLQGYRATTHWMAMEDLALLGAVAVHERVVIDGNRITGGGVTAGIDFALTLIAELWGAPLARRIQLGLEYDPHPPFNAGSPRTALPEEVKEVLQRSQTFLERRHTATVEAAEQLGLTEAH